MLNLGKSTPNIPFMDEVHKWTFSRKHHKGQVMSPASTKVLATYRMKLREAQKFLLDNETVKLICNLSHQEQEIPKFSVLARLPYPTMWIEFNLHIKCLEYEKMGSLRGPFNPNEVSPVIGYLLFQDNHSTRWIAHSFLKITSPGWYTVTPNLLSFIFDPDGEPQGTLKGSEFWRAPTLSHRPNGLQIPCKIPHQKLEGWVDAEYVLSGDLEKDPQSPHHIIGAPWSNRGAAIVDPYWTSYTPETLDDNVLRMEVLENAGIIRWLVTLLGSLNALPKDLKQTQTRVGTRQVGAHILPYFQHRTITINLPRDDRIIWAHKHVESSLKNMPRPWHEVIGHWRVIERGKSTHLCRHIPTMIEKDIAMCERCQLLVRWIPAHHRGDPSVGIVNHTYKTKAKRPPNLNPNLKPLDQIQLNDLIESP